MFVFRPVVGEPSSRGDDCYMSRILVTEKIAEAGLESLRRAGHEVDVNLGLSPEQLIEAVVGASALIIRSSTQVTSDVLSAGSDLVVVGRAGIGLDNVDVGAATDRGVMVVNAPQSNTLSAAEHTMAMLLAQARNIPQAHSALTDGRWERSKWEGVELSDKTLGVIGLGRIGKLVAHRAAAFGMKIVAYDPFVSAEIARKLGIDVLNLADLMATADFVTIHVAKTPDTIGLIGKEVLAAAKSGLRLVNVARGGIVDEAALADAILEGRVAGAAFDVFETEPCIDSPLFGVPGVVVTPHLGASTREAQDKAGVTIAEQVQLALTGDFVPFAVNVDASEATEVLKPFLPLAERLGSIFAFLVDGLPGSLDVEFRGDVAGVDTRYAVLAAVKGLMSQVSDQPASYVNALSLASERGLEVRTITVDDSDTRTGIVALRGGGHSITGTLSPLDGGFRVIGLDGHSLEIRPGRNMLVVRNDDTPGMVGVVGAALGDAGVNISNMHIGETDEGVAALMVVATAVPVPPAVQDALRQHPHIQAVRAIGLS